MVNLFVVICFFLLMFLRILDMLRGVLLVEFEVLDKGGVSELGGGGGGGFFGGGGGGFWGGGGGVFVFLVDFGFLGD